MVLITMDRMRLVLLIIAVFAVEIQGKVTKKSQKDLEPTEKKLSAKKVSGQKAIIAIEIVDPNDNSTKLGKGRKRTIESSLGYGYQSFFNVQQSPPKYQVYKYSQQDIPASKGNSVGLAPPAHNVAPAVHPVHSGPNIDVQKSVRYDLGSTKPEFVSQGQKYSKPVDLNQYYQPGTTLFSTLDQQGHVGGLSAQAPQHNQGDGMVPVIILRVFTNQLSQPGALHANIPSGHPYANINNIDLQNLLSGYVQNHYQQNYQRSQSQSQNQGYYYQQPQYQPQGYQYDDGLQTHENYPDDAHTKVIFHKETSNPVKTKPAPKAPSAITKPASTPQKFKITIPENTFSKVEIQDHSYGGQSEDQQAGYYYDTPAQQPQYYQSQQQHAAPVQYQDAKQYVQIQTYPQQNQQYQYEYQAPAQGYLPQNHYQQQQVYYQSAYEQPQSYQEQSYGSTNDYQEQVYQSGPQEQAYSTPHQQVYQVPQQQVYDHQTREQQSIPTAHQSSYQSSSGQSYQTSEEQTYQSPKEQSYQVPQESQKYLSQESSTTAGRDLHSKLYNYHAHEAVQQPKTRSTLKKRRAKPQAVKHETTEKH